MVDIKPAPRAAAVSKALIANAPWIGLVLAAAAFGQWLVLHNGAVPIVSSDGIIYYLADVHALPALQGLVDAKVPPGYPLLLSGVFAIAGHDNLEAVLLVQSALFVAAIVETYALLTTIGIQRVLSSAVASALGAAPWLVQWERYVLAETFSFWAIVTLLLVFTRLLRHPTWSSALLCGLIGAAIPMTRAALVLVPGTLLLVLLGRIIASRRAGHRLAGATRAALLFAVVSYAPVVVYIVANAAVNGCYCYTSIGNVNLFGKIYEYGMKDFPAAPQYSSIAEQVAASDGVNGFLASHPEYARLNYAPLSAYARSQFLRYPGTFLRKTARDLRDLLVLNVDHAVVQEHPHACRDDPALPYPLVTGDVVTATDAPLCPTTTVSVGKLGEDVNWFVYLLIFVAYVTLPISLALGAVLALARPLRDRVWFLLATAAVASSALVTAAVTGYIAFDRLKVPVDGIALTAAVLMVGELWFLLSEVRRKLGARRAAAATCA